MLPPVLPEKWLEGCLEDIPELLEAGEDIENQHFYGEALPELTEMVCEFSGCFFEKCSFSECGAKRLIFVDCVFAGCDASGMVFPRATFQRVQFRECRLTGAQFTKNSLQQVTFQECRMEYANFNETKAQHVTFTRCALQESYFSRFHGLDWTFQACDLRRAEWMDTVLKGLDVTTCRTEGWRVSLSALRGLKVTADQALQFVTLLGLEVIPDPPEADHRS